MMLPVGYTLKQDWGQSLWSGIGGEKKGKELFSQELGSPVWKIRKVKGKEDLIHFKPLSEKSMNTIQEGWGNQWLSKNFKFSEK